MTETPITEEEETFIWSLVAARLASGAERRDRPQHEHQSVSGGRLPMTLKEEVQAEFAMMSEIVRDTRDALRGPKRLTITDVMLDGERKSFRVARRP